ncbi:hypothetical protein BDA96_08G097500 [Sorghum bicolor]|nr:hypothetical protein BDA96_08G097500 [Sorghum bicolor]
MSDYIQQMKKIKGPISKHFLDLQFWMIIDFGRHPNFRKELDMEKLKESIHKWPGIEYNVSRCKSIFIPITQLGGAFILIILNQETKTVYILDPNPPNPIYKYNPNAKYVKILQCISENLQKAMAKACPEPKWKEDIFLWRQIILTDIPIYNRELSGYLVSMFMTAWKNEALEITEIKDAYSIRKHFLGQLLTINENECEDNLPTGVQDLIRCIKYTQI